MKNKILEELTELIGTNPSPKLLALLKRKNIIQDYNFEANGVIKIYPIPPVEWIEKLPEKNSWIYKTITQ